MNDTAGQRFRRDERLRSRECIERIFESGYSARTGKMLARFIFGGERPCPMRFGFAVGRKIGNAVTRNRYKRVMREAVRLEKAKYSDRLLLLHRSADIMFLWISVSEHSGTSLVPEIRCSVREMLDTVMKKAESLSEVDN